VSKKKRKTSKEENLLKSASARDGKESEPGRGGRLLKGQLKCDLRKERRGGRFCREKKLWSQ